MDFDEAREHRCTGEVTRYDFSLGYYNERKIKFLLENKKIREFGEYL